MSGAYHASVNVIYFESCVLYRSGVILCILGDPGAASRDDGIFMGESLQQERESPHPRRPRGS